MKRLIVTAFLICLATNIKAQNNRMMENQQKDIAAISTALQDYYFKGLYEGDANLVGTVFNPGSLLFGDVKGAPYAKTLTEYLDGVKNRQSPKDSGKPFKGEIMSVHVVNTIAVAEVSVRMYDFAYRDLLSFHLIDGKWLIVNKMLTDTKN